MEEKTRRIEIPPPRFGHCTGRERMKLPRCAGSTLQCSPGIDGSPDAWQSDEQTIGELTLEGGALESLDAGVRKVHIVDASMPHSVLLEIYSDTGVGTEIVP